MPSLWQEPGLLLVGDCELRYMYAVSHRHHCPGLCCARSLDVPTAASWQSKDISSNSHFQSSGVN